MLLLSSRPPACSAWHTIPRSNVSPKDPTILGFASTINHRTPALSLNFYRLHLCKIADLKTKGSLSFRYTTNDIPWKYLMHSCPAVILDQIHQILSARVYFAYLGGDFNCTVFNTKKNWNKWQN